MITAFITGTVLLAGIMRGITGFGGAMLMTPPLGIILGAGPAIILVLILEAAAALVMLPAIRHDLPLRRMTALALPTCLTVPIGSWILGYLDPSLSRRLIGAVVVIFSLVLISGFRYVRKPGEWLTAGIGALSGVMLGATSIGAPPVILFLLSGPDPVQTTRALLTAFISITSVMGVCTSLLVGHVPPPSPTAVFLLAIVYLGATLVGTKVFYMLSDLGARLIALALMLIFGLSAVLIG